MEQLDAQDLTLFLAYQHGEKPWNEKFENPDLQPRSENRTRLRKC